MKINMKKLNILIIWLWHHSRRIYLPSIFENKKKLNIGNVIWVDIAPENKITKELKKNYLELKVFLLKNKKDYKELLEKLRKKFNINMLIIATDPPNHFQYIKYALENRIHTITDKPILLAENIAHEEEIVKKLKKDTELIFAKAKFLISGFINKNKYEVYLWDYDKISNRIKIKEKVLVKISTKMVNKKMVLLRKKINYA